MDPRQYKSKEDWEWAELNAFHAANNARELLDEIEGMIAEAEFLRKKERGEVDDNAFRKMFSKLVPSKEE